MTNFTREGKTLGLLGSLSSTHYVRYWATSQVKWLLTYSNKFNSLLCSYSKPVDSHTKGQTCRTAALETTNCPVPCVMWALVNALTWIMGSGYHLLMCCYMTWFSSFLLVCYFRFLVFQKICNLLSLTQHLWYLAECMYLL